VIPGVTIQVPAKINVQLSAGGPEPAGFHELATVFLTVGLYDEVTVTPADTLRITVSGPDSGLVPTDGGNLAARAATALAERLGVRPSVAVHIAKGIPVAGGMAGGSADAAAALLGCARLWEADLALPELLRIGADLGSDVPFCLTGGAALGLGRGERLTALPLGGPLHWVVAVAAGGLSTPAVYRECDRLRGAARIPDPLPFPPVLKALAAGDAPALARALDEYASAPPGEGHANDLQPAALSLRPKLRDTLRVGRTLGALTGFVSGSGPTCVFLVPDARSAALVAEGLSASGTCASATAATSSGEGPLVRYVPKTATAPGSEADRA
jgi:4-diphosphocytidyl-2-C-methyl-D-erythritol kinase